MYARKSSLQTALSNYKQQTQLQDTNNTTAIGGIGRWSNELEKKMKQGLGGGGLTGDYNISNGSTMGGTYGSIGSSNPWEAFLSSSMVQNQKQDDNPLMKLYTPQSAGRHFSYY